MAAPPPAVSPSGRRRDANSTTGASKQRPMRCGSFLRPHANLTLSSAAVLPHRAHDEVGLVGASGGENRVKRRTGGRFAQLEVVLDWVCAGGVCTGNGRPPAHTQSS